MRFTSKSIKLIKLFMKNNHYYHEPFTIKTKSLLKILYDNIAKSYAYSSSLQLDKPTIKKITSSSQITLPKNFDVKSIPEPIRKHIGESTMTELHYSFSLDERRIQLIFVIENRDRDIDIPLYDKYVRYIIMWLKMLNLYASKKCVRDLTVYFYFTSLNKELPESNVHVLNENNVNTAFTTTCPVNSEIVIFRKEEWFKVLIHESFHNFGLDFSGMDNDDVKRCILDIFPVKSDVNAFESYTEFWAEIINALFCSYTHLKNKADFNEFLYNAELFINFERTYSLFQMVKTLDFMNLSYEDLFTKTKHSQMLRDNLYREKSSILAYYVIKTILMINYQGFLLWCSNNNFSLLDFNKTRENQIQFCKYIKMNYKTKHMIDGVHNSVEYLHKLSNKKRVSKDIDFMLSNMRMSICELG